MSSDPNLTQNIQEKFAQAKQLQSQGNIAEAVLEYRAILEADNRNLAALHQMGQLSEGQGEFAVAIEHYRRAIELDSESPFWVYRHLGFALSQQDQIEEAVEAYQKAIKLNPEDVATYGLLGQAYGTIGDIDGAISSYQKQIELSSNIPIWVYLNLGDGLSQRDRIEEAISAYEKALALEPENVGIQRLLAGVVYRREAEVKDPCDRARQLQEAGNLEEALSEYHRVLAEDGSNLVALHQVAQICESQGKWDEAVEGYRRAIEVDAGSPFWVYRHLGFALSQLGDVDGAVEAYEKAVELNPEDSAAQSLLDKVTALKESSDRTISICENVPNLTQQEAVDFKIQEEIDNFPKIEMTVTVKVAQALFDDNFYRQQYLLQEDIKQLSKEELFRHFIQNVDQQLAAPTKWFFPEIYKDIHTQILSSKDNPFLHYIKNGYVQGLSPLHNIKSIPIDTVKSRIDALFDFDFYVSNNVDLDPQKINILEHFAAFGWKEGRNPSPWFDLSVYQTEFPIVRELEINPLYFYACLHSGDPRKQACPVNQQDSNFKKAVKIRPQRKNRHVPRSAVEFKFLLEKTGYLQPERFSHNVKKAQAHRLKIHIVIPEFSKGGGGHMTIFRIVRWLEFFGHECTVWVKDPALESHPTGWRDDVYRDYQQVKASFLPLSVNFWYVTGDVLVATSWDTVEAVMAHKGFNDRFYLIQDYEPYFFARGSASLRAEDTYRQDIACICASTWLRKLMEEKFGRWARHFDLAYESDVYKIHEDKNLRIPSNEDGLCHLVVYSRKHTARRAVELCLEALEELAHRRNDFVVHFFGANEVISEVTYQAFNHGILDKHELAELYNNGTIGITFSATNYSLVPQEMMACSLPILEIENESTVYIFPPDAVAMARPNPIAIANEIESLMDNPLRRENQAKTALQWISGLSWETSVRSVEKAFLDRLSEIGRIEETGSIQVNEKHQYHASVVIPTFNGGELLKNVLDRVRQQHTPWSFQIVIVDSSSTDGTREYLDQQQDIFLHTIPQSEFQHGATRNLGVKLSDAEYVAFLTQDALPAGNYWLYDLVSCLEAHPSAAGAFGRHVAYENASEFTKRDLLQHFEGFDRFPVEVSLHTDFEKIKQGDRGWRQILHFYSDNNSCLRKSVWERYPYPEVSYGEDQLWADTIIKAGYSKVYSKSALVYHSHDYDYQETFQRSKTEAEFFLACFGYKMVESRKQLEIDLASLNKRDIDYGKSKNLSALQIVNQLNLNRAKFEGWSSLL